MKKVFYIFLVNTVMWFLIGLFTLIFGEPSKVTYGCMWLSLVAFLLMITVDCKVESQIEEWENR